MDECKVMLQTHLESESKFASRLGEMFCFFLYLTRKQQQTNKSPQFCPVLLPANYCTVSVIALPVLYDLSKSRLFTESWKAKQDWTYSS